MSSNLRPNEDRGRASLSLDCALHGSDFAPSRRRAMNWEREPVDRSRNLAASTRDFGIG